jgi:predicted O-linked N-acetylglucosamine transferase (SPINDLY family)
MPRGCADACGAQGILMFATMFVIPARNPDYHVAMECCYDGPQPLTAVAFRTHTHTLSTHDMTCDGWMRILNAVEGSILWLLEDNPWAGDNLKKEATNCGIDSRRLIFDRRLPLSEHLSRHRQADLFLDTIPYGAHTTASDALWSGLPVLTLIGQSFAGRVAASLLNAIGLPELITNTQEEYEALAIELAMKPKKLADIKLKLVKNRLSTPLFDAPLFTKDLEAAYIRMFEGYQADLLPDHISIV